MSIGPAAAFVIGNSTNATFDGRVADEPARLGDIGEICVTGAAAVCAGDGDA
jgi:hypothetical protein